MLVDSMLQPYVVMSVSETESEECRKHEYSSGDDDNVDEVLKSAGAASPSKTLFGDDKKPKAKAKPDLKKKKTKKPKDMPRRPLSAYNVFFRDERARILEERASARSKGATATASGANLFSALGKEVARRWKDLDEEQLKKYNAAAEEEMARYRREMDEYHVGLARKRRLEENNSSSSLAGSSRGPATESSLGFNNSTTEPNSLFRTAATGISSTLPLFQGSSVGHDKNNSVPDQLQSRNFDLCNDITGGLMGCDLSRLPTEYLINQLRQQDANLLLRNLNAPVPNLLGGGLPQGLGVFQQLQQHQRNLNLERLLRLRTQMQGNTNALLLRQLLQQPQLGDQPLDDSSELRRLALQMQVPIPPSHFPQQQPLLHLLSRQSSDIISYASSNQSAEAAAGAGGNDLSQVIAMLRRQHEGSDAARPDESPSSHRDSF